MQTVVLGCLCTAEFVMGQVIDNTWLLVIQRQWEYSELLEFELFAISHLYLIHGLFL